MRVSASDGADRAQEPHRTRGTEKSRSITGRLRQTGAASKIGGSRGTAALRRATSFGPLVLFFMIADRVVSRCQSYMRILFLDRAGPADTAAHLERMMDRHGLSDVRIVKTREDSKVIARGIHAEWGHVGIKVIDPIASPGLAYQGLNADALVTEHPSRMLPRIYDHGLGYSVVEWIDGEESKLVDPTRFTELPFVELVDDVADWCSRAHPAEPLDESAIQAILRFYIHVTVRRMSYRDAGQCLSAAVRFGRDRQRVAGFLDQMAALAPRLRLARTMMLSDLHPRNVIHDGSGRRMVFIDYEAMRPGSYLFDVVFLLAYLVAMGAPRATTERLGAHVFSPSYLGCSAADPFFRAFASYIAATYMTVDGDAPASVEAALAAIAGFGGAAP
jgi:hypothetical protein